MPAENIHFDSDGCTLAGTYVQAAAPVAAALLITGSGRTDRDSDARLPFHQTLTTTTLHNEAENLRFAAAANRSSPWCGRSEPTSPAGSLSQGQGWPTQNWHHRQYRVVQMPVGRAIMNAVSSEKSGQAGTLCYARPGGRSRM